MEVFLVLETADCTTEYVFATRELADAFVKREGRRGGWLWKYAVEPMTVQTELPSVEV